MNGIIHNCTHANMEGKEDIVLSEDDMFARIFEYISRLVLIVRPRRLIYLAIDGTYSQMNEKDYVKRGFSK